MFWKKKRDQRATAPDMAARIKAGQRRIISDFADEIGVG